MKSPHGIMEKLVSKGGLIGFAAKAEINKSENHEQFIIECFEQCHHSSALKLWGHELVMEIVAFRLFVLRRDLRWVLQERKNLGVF